jgi:hypothetical protein
VPSHNCDGTVPALFLASGSDAVKERPCRTSELTSGSARCRHLAGGEPALPTWISPEETGAVVVRAIKRGDLYALTHPDWYPIVEQRHQALAAAFRQAAEDQGSGSG